MTDALIELRNIDLTYNPGTVNESCLFTGFNFKAEKGEFVSIVGSNGSGKTSMLNLICGGLAAQSGKILLEGKDISKVPEFKRAKRIGRVFQNPALGTSPELSIMENLSLADNKGKRYGLGRGVESSSRERMREMVSTLHMGLEDKMDLKAGSLSGGQRQALALLIATMTPLDLLILDEHTASLDPNSSETVMELTDKLVAEKGLTAIMVTHNLRYAVEYGSRIMMMHEGEAVLDMAGAEKEACRVEDLLEIFNEMSIECGN